MKVREAMAQSISTVKPDDPIQRVAQCIAEEHDGVRSETVRPDASVGRPPSVRAFGLGVLVAMLLAVVAAVAPWSAGMPVSGANTAAGKRFDARITARLDHALRATWASTWSPGVIAGVWVGHRGWTSTLGSTRRSAGPRPALSDHTRVGSVTKTMIGTLILELVDQRKLSLDEPIARWFPKVPEASRITIRQLGDMSSGINSYTFNSKLTDQYFLHPTMWWKPNTLIAGGVALPRRFAPGDGFFYSDTNFVMLGRIIELVTHQPLAKAMQSMLFKPLGMRHSSYPTNNWLPKPFLRGYTVQGSQHGNVIDSTSWSPSFAAGAGQATSTLADLHRWTVAVGTGALLKPATQRQRLIPNPASVAAGRAYLFALGFDHGWLTHTGEIPGFNTVVAYLPQLRASIVVITNCDISDANVVSPAPAIFKALAQVISPNHVPAS